MTEARRQQVFTGVSIALLLFAAAFDNAWLLAGTALALLAAGFVALPRQRVRGALTAAIAALVAFAMATVIGALQG